MKPIPLQPNLPTPTTWFGTPKPSKPWYICPHCNNRSPLEDRQGWVELTDKEIESVWHVAMFKDHGTGPELVNQPFVHFARALEAKFKEKNT